MKQLEINLINPIVETHNFATLRFGINAPVKASMTTADGVKFNYVLTYRGLLSDYIGTSTKEGEPHILTIDPINETQGFFFVIKLKCMPDYYDSFELAQFIIDTALERIEENKKELEKNNKRYKEENKYFILAK